MNYQIGQTIGGYEILGMLGAGGMGEVYRVRNVISDRIDAMKVLLGDLRADQELASRFIREIKVQARLDHRNIAHLYTAFEHEGQLIMILELIQGNTLSEKLRAGRLPLSEAVGYVSQALQALEYAHQHQVIHRDIKPANMMVTPAGTVKVMDFGIAKAVSEKTLTTTGGLIGSLHYMSPEQVRGDDSIDGRTDLYSLGVVLYEMATGKKPFDGKSEYTIMKAHLEQPPVPPTHLDPSVPVELSGIILRALTKQREDRFQTAREMLDALKEIAPQGASAEGRTPPRHAAEPSQQPWASPSPGTSPEPEATSWLRSGLAPETPSSRVPPAQTTARRPPWAQYAPEEAAPPKEQSGRAERQPETWTWEPSSSPPPQPRQSQGSLGEESAEADSGSPPTSRRRSQLPVLIGSTLALIAAAGIIAVAIHWSNSRPTIGDQASSVPRATEIPAQPEGVRPAPEEDPNLAADWVSPTGEPAAAEPTPPPRSEPGSIGRESPAVASGRPQAPESRREPQRPTNPPVDSPPPAPVRASSQPESPPTTGASPPDRSATPAPVTVASGAPENPPQPAVQKPAPPPAVAATATPTGGNTAPASVPAKAADAVSAPPPTAPVDRVYEPGEVDNPPQLIHRVPPRYTESAHKAGIQGTVRLETEIWPDGKAHNIRVVNSVGDAGLDQNAAHALSQWRFAAGRKAGQPVKVRALIDLSFRLEGGGRRPGLSLDKK